ncbi:hypothetical protein, partial [Streptomyces sp. NPDC055506]
MLEPMSLGSENMAISTLLAAGGDVRGVGLVGLVGGVEEGVEGVSGEGVCWVRTGAGWRRGGLWLWVEAGLA